MNINKYEHWVILFVVVAIGTILRLVTLDKEPIWLDEAFTVLYSSLSWVNICTNYSQDVHPPLFYLLEHVFFVFGTSEFIIRLFPAICGIITIPIFYLIGKEVLDRTSGLLMASMLCLSEFHLMYSQEARMYTLLLLFTTCALYFWLRFNKEQNQWNLILFSVFSALACWTHFFAIIPFMILLVLLPGRQVVLATTLTGMLCLPMLPGVLEMVSYQLSVTLTGLTGISVITQSLWAIGGFYPVGMYILTFLFAAGCFLLWKNGEHRLAIACALTIFGSLLFGAVVGGRVHIEARYFIYTLPLLFLAVAVVVKKVGEVKC